MADIVLVMEIVPVPLDIETLIVVASTVALIVKMAGDIAVAVAMGRVFVDPDTTDLLVIRKAAQAIA